MKIANWRLNEQADATEVSADVDGYRLRYQVPKPYRVTRLGDPFLAAALFPAMRQGTELVVEPPLAVSPRFLRNAAMLQEVFHSWLPDDLQMVPIKAETAIAERVNAGVFSFFSGGVDSTYTFLKHTDEVNHVVNVYGLDFYFERGGAPTFSVADLKDLSQFAWKLMLPYDPVSAYLKGILSGGALQTLARYRDSGLDPGTAESALVDELNRIAGGRLIFEPRRFSGVQLRPETRDLLARNPEGEELCGLNRLLLEDAYPREIVGKNSGAFEETIERNRRFVGGFGKSLVRVDTNHYPFGYRYNLSRNVSQGACLGSVALLLGMPRVYWPTSYSYAELAPNGTHPLTDPLWSNECMEIIHDGCEMTRAERLGAICKSEAAVKNLRVCFHDPNVNCGVCDKCLRTMIALRFLNVSNAPFPPLPSAKELLKILPVNGVEMAYFKENLDLAQCGGNEELEEVLRRVVRKLERKRLLTEFDRVFLGGIVTRTRERLLKSPPRLRRIDTPHG